MITSLTVLIFMGFLWSLANKIVGAININNENKHMTAADLPEWRDTYIEAQLDDLIAKQREKRYDDEQAKIAEEQRLRAWTDYYARQNNANVGEVARYNKAVRGANAADTTNAVVAALAIGGVFAVLAASLLLG